MSGNTGGTDQIFVDGVGRIMISGMTIRIELTTVDPSTADKTGQSRSAVQQRLIMPIDGFVRTVQQLNRIVGRLEKMGVIKKGEPQRPAQEVIETPDDGGDEAADKPSANGKGGERDAR